jgi:hypothetical protein
VSEQEFNGGKKYGQKGTLCGPNSSLGLNTFPSMFHLAIISYLVPFPNGNPFSFSAIFEVRENFNSSALAYCFHYEL